MIAAINVAQPACWLITLYQRYLSPYKGFSCAYRVRRRRASCSAFAKRALSRFGLFLGAMLLRRRFRKCHAAAQARVLDYETLESKKEAKQSSTSASSCVGDGLGACADPGCHFGIDACGEIGCGLLDGF